jgi:hypothetical protein
MCAHAAMRLIGNQGYERFAQATGARAACRHVLLLRTAYACASMAYGVRWRQGYENSGYAQLTLLLLLARTRGVRRARRVIHLEPLMSGNLGESARALHIVIERTCTVVY